MRRRSGLLSLIILALLLMPVACADPAQEGRVGEGAPGRPLGADQPDPRRDTLVVALSDLHATLQVARGHLAEAEQADDVASGRAAGQRAVDGLLATADIESPDNGVRPLFPAESADPAGSMAREDALTVTLTAARDAGSVGSGVVDLLRDPLAGDLGAWQRDAAGVVAIVRQTVATTSDLQQLEAEVLTLAGEGTRALAWALLTAQAASLDEVHAYAERAGTHLDIVLQAVDAELAALRPAEPDLPDDQAPDDREQG